MNKERNIQGKLLLLSSLFNSWKHSRTLEGNLAQKERATFMHRKERKALRRM